VEEVQEIGIEIEIETVFMIEIGIEIGIETGIGIGIGKGVVTGIVRGIGAEAGIGIGTGTGRDIVTVEIMIEIDTAIGMREIAEGVESVLESDFMIEITEIVRERNDPTPTKATL